MLKDKGKILAVAALSLMILINPGRVLISPIKEDVLNIQDQISDKKSQSAELEKQAAKYRAEIQKREAEQVTLENEVGILKNRVAATELDVAVLQIEIEATVSEITQLEADIVAKNAELDHQKQIVATLVREIHENDQVSYLEVLLNNNSLSEFFDRIEQLQNLEQRTYGAILSLKDIREDLVVRKQKVDEKRVALDAEKGSLIKLKALLEAEQVAKNTLIQEVAMSEQKFQALLYEVRQDELAAESQIRKLEGSLKELLEKNDDTPGEGTILTWPVGNRIITATFHDPTYPFRRLFEHSGIDLAVNVGTPIKAAAPGYVASVKTGASYGNYVMVIHKGGVATLYAHLSKFSVKLDTMIERGQIIGYSGGAAGAPGSGLSTGPHLHFETRVDGIPQNPLKFLVEVSN
ncbi:MAG: peptidoglycan DD-metalloendopeptidase family protein [bacterium]